ncbi:Golgi transport complex subunit 1 [Lobulomyces angularis]|nr:Golgi transport complex subunit 1 [Lobulomyces angularis]
MATRSDSFQEKDDAEELFKEHSIGELRLIEVKLKNDIEKKKQDLRIMVGERYRDVIEAADSISAMKSYGIEVVTKFESLLEICNTHNLEQQLLNKSFGKKDSNTDEKKKRLYPVAAQIKLLVDTPEQIWHALENHHYLRASRLYSMARLVHVTLQSSSEAAALKLNSSFPVVQRQWEAVSHFKSQIIEKATAYISVTSQTDQSLTETILSIMLLDTSTLKQLLEKVLCVRKNAILETLDSYRTSESSIADHFKRVVHIITITIKQLSNIFLHRKIPQDARAEKIESVIEAYISSLQQKIENTNIITGLYSERTNIHIVFKYLPHRIQNHTPFFNVALPNQPLTQDMILEMLKNFLSQILVECKSNISKILDFVESGKDLFDLRKALLCEISLIQNEANNMEIVNSTLMSPFEKSVFFNGNHIMKRKSSNFLTSDKSGTFSHKILPHFTWAELFQCRLIPDGFCFWKDLFREPIVEKSRQIIKQSFKKLSLQPKNILLPMLENLSLEDTDISSFIWSSKYHGNKPCGCNVTSFNLDKTFESTVLEIHSDMLPLIRSRVEFKSDLSKFEVYGNQRSSKDSLLRFNSSVVNTPRGISFDLPEQLSIFTNEIDEFNLNIDTTALFFAFQEEYTESVTVYRNNLISIIMDLQKNLIEETDDEAFRLMNKCLSIGKTAQNIALRIKSISKSIYPSTMATFSGGTPTYRAPKAKADHLNQDLHYVLLQNLMMKVYDYSHKVWASFILKRFEKILSVNLRRQNYKNFIKSLEIWEVIDIKDGDPERENAVNSQIILPCHCSEFLLQDLFSLLRNFNSAVGFGMEMNVLTFFIKSFGAVIINVYKSYLEEAKENDLLSEKGALQLLFDYKYLMKVVEGGLKENASLDTEFKEGLNTEEKTANFEKEAQSLVSEIKEMIDPIDMAVVEMALVSHVERYYFRTSVVLGSFLILNPKLIELKRMATSLQDQQTVVALAATPPRFALLPVSENFDATYLGSPDKKFMEANLNQFSIKRKKPKFSLSLTAKNASKSNNSLQQTASTINAAGSITNAANLIRSGTPELSWQGSNQRASDLFNATSSYLSNIWGSNANVSSPILGKKTEK